MYLMKQHKICIVLFCFLSIGFDPYTALGLCVCTRAIYWLLNILYVSVRTGMWQGQKKMNYFNVIERKKCYSLYFY